MALHKTSRLIQNTPMSEELQNPFVIQCRECRRILGDSFSLVAFQQNCLVLSSVSSSVITKECKIESTEPHDLKCHYVVACCKCSKPVGKKYLTVNDAMKECIGRYCISREAVTSYMLGTESAPEDVSLSTLAEEVSKLQRFCVSLYKKLQRER